jgi:hypothetical protein
MNALVSRCHMMRKAQVFDFFVQRVSWISTSGLSSARMRTVLCHSACVCHPSRSAASCCGRARPPRTIYARNGILTWRGLRETFGPASKNSHSRALGWLSSEAKGFRDRVLV